MQTCIKCSSNEQAVQSFCPICGERLSNVPKEQVKRKKPSFELVKEIIKKSVVLAISIFMLIAAFLPIFKYTIEFETFDEETQTRFNAIDAIVFYFTSFQNLDEEEFSEELEEFLEDAEYKYDDFEDWEDGKSLESVGPFLKKYLRFSLRSEESDASFAGFLCALTAIAYVASAILLTVFSALSFASVFTGKVKDKSHISTPLLILQTILSAIFAIIFTLEYGIGKLTISSGSHTLMKMETELSDVQIAVISLGIACVAMLAVFRIFFEQKPKIKVGAIVKYALSCTFAIALMLSVCLPIINTTVKALFSDTDYDYTGYPDYEYIYEYEKANGKIGNGIFSSLDFSKATKETLGDMSDDELEEYTIENESIFSMIQKKSYKKGEGELADHTVFSAMLLNFGGYEYSAVFVAGIAANYLVLICAGIILWLNIRAIAMGNTVSKKHIIPAKVVAIVMAVVILALTIVMCIVVTTNARLLSKAADSEFSYKATIGAGSIVMLVCAIGCACVPTVKKSREQDIESCCECVGNEPKAEEANEAAQDTAESLQNTQVNN